MKKNRHPFAENDGLNIQANDSSQPPILSGQRAEVLELIRLHQPVLSFVLTADHAIPEAASRIHELRALGFNIISIHHAEVMFRGRIRRNAVSYSLGSPEWIQPTLPPLPESLTPDLFEQVEGDVEVEA